MSGSSSSEATQVLLTGFERFGSLSANPTGRAVRRLARDPDCRDAGVRCSVMPVDRELSPSRLANLLKRHRPQALVLSGVAADRGELCFERTAVNVWRGLGEQGHGRPIAAGGPDGLFATAPLSTCLAALKRGGPARISESAGTFVCNLVFYEALRWCREGTPWGGPAPRWVAFIHSPATAGCGAPTSSPLIRPEELESGLKALVLNLAARLKAAPVPGSVRGESGRQR